MCDTFFSHHSQSASYSITRFITRQAMCRRGTNRLPVEGHEIRPQTCRLRPIAERPLILAHLLQQFPAHDHTLSLGLPHSHQGGSHRASGGRIHAVIQKYFPSKKTLRGTQHGVQCSQSPSSRVHNLRLHVLVVVSAVVGSPIGVAEGRVISNGRDCGGGTQADSLGAGGICKTTAIRTFTESWWATTSDWSSPGGLGSQDIMEYGLCHTTEGRFKVV